MNLQQQQRERKKLEFDPDSQGNVSSVSAHAFALGFPALAMLQRLRSAVALLVDSLEIDIMLVPVSRPTQSVESRTILESSATTMSLLSFKTRYCQHHVLVLI